MPRANRTSRVQFDINIKGEKDARKLLTVIKQLNKEFKELASSLDKLESAQGRGGRTSGDVSDAMSRVKLGIAKGDINNIKQLTGHYGQLVKQINDLERAGKNVNSMRLRAFELYDRERKKIEESIRAKRESNQADLQAMSTTDSMRRGLLEKIGTLNISEEATRRATQATNDMALAQKNAAYLILNAGYLIQDSPYGIRGVANNISQLAQSYQMLRERVEFLNKTQGANITVAQSLISLLKGPTGMILLVGSILPASLEVLSMNWDKWFGSVEKTNEELQEAIDLFNKFRDATASMTRFDQDDPLGILSLRDERDALAEQAQAIRDFQDASQQLVDWQRQVGRLERIAPDSDEMREARDQVRFWSNEVEILRRQYGELVDQELDDVIDQIERTQELLTIQEHREGRFEYLMREAPAIKAELEEIVKIAESGFWSEPASDEMIEGAKRSAAQWIDAFSSYLRENVRDLSTKEKGLLVDAITSFQDIFAEDEEEEDDEVFDRSSILQERQQALSDMNALEVFYAEQRVAQADSAEQQIEAIREASAIRMREIERARTNDEYDNYYQYKMDILKLEQDTSDRIVKINEEQAEREKRLEELKAQRKRQIQSNYSSFVIQSGQALFNALNASSRSQFRANKIASASQAIINGYLAFTKTLAQGGALATPLAYSTLALAFAQAGNIMSQSYDSARTTGAGYGSGKTLSYRGIDFRENQMAQFAPFQGSPNVSRNNVDRSTMFPKEVKAKFTDGFGKVVSEGTLQLQRENKEDLGYWSQ